MLIGLSRDRGKYSEEKEGEGEGFGYGLGKPPVGDGLSQVMQYHRR